MTVFQIRALKRDEDKEKGSKLRAKGEIPAIFYRKNTQSIPLKLKQKDVNALLKAPKGLVRIQMDNNQTVLAVAKEVQLEPVGNHPLHIQFEGIKEGEAFHISLPIKIEHDKNCDWEKNKGQCIQKISHLNVELLPKDMPDAIHVNVDNLNIGDTLTVEDLKFKGIKFLDNPHTEVLSITYTRVMDLGVQPAAATEITAVADSETPATNSPAAPGPNAPHHPHTPTTQIPPNTHTHTHNHTKAGKH
jgi:large subunit ribosomal protein L25